MMKIACVFGGSGFLGSHVADKLSDAGYKVRIFDLNQSPWLRRDQEMCVGNILNFDEVAQAVSGADVVYNFAGLADLNEGINKPLKSIEVNILGNAYIMEACRKYNVKRFVYASTVYVYSREGGFYRCSKQASESYVEEYQKEYGLNYTILRYGSLYGPRSDETNGLYRIVKNALESKQIYYEGSKEALREYVHVEDAAYASIKALSDEFKNDSLVLTGQEPMRVLDLLGMLAEILGYEGEIKHNELTQAGHYVKTPYAYKSRLGRKFVLPLHVDLGQGLIQLIEEIQSSRIK